MNRCREKDGSVLELVETTLLEASPEGTWVGSNTGKVPNVS